MAGRCRTDPPPQTDLRSERQRCRIAALAGFTQLTILSDATAFEDIQLSKTYGGQHGTDRAYAVPELAERLGEACGVVFRHPDEKTLLLAGDTVWRAEVAAELQKHQPDVVVLNAGYAHVIGCQGSHCRRGRLQPVSLRPEPQTTVIQFSRVVEALK